MIDNNPRSNTSASFCLDWQTVSHALDLAEGFAEALALNEDVRARLAIIVEELIANIVEHGGSPVDKPVTLTLALDGDDIAMTISNGGLYFDPRTPVENGPVPPERGGGAGLALIQHWARDISYTHSDGRNILKLIVPVHG